MKDFSVYARGGRLEFVDATIESEVAEPPLAIDGFTPGAGTVETRGELFDKLSSFFRRLWFPQMVELVGVEPRVTSLGQIAPPLFAGDNRPFVVQRFQPRDGDGPGWALLEEVRL